MFRNIFHPFATLIVGLQYFKWCVRELTVITVAVATARYDHRVAHQVIADWTEQLVWYRVRLILRC